ncbi:MAG: cold shock domain-containing protein [Deltaproteobacteria bacterium]|nr:cold shock domain-containing protein [Deltaproteobacteria bacterium]
MKGTIKRLIKERGFGFIRAEEGRVMFFHRTAVDSSSFASLIEGQSVEFDVERSTKDPQDKRLRAVHVRLNV